MSGVNERFIAVKRREFTWPRIRRHTTGPDENRSRDSRDTTYSSRESDAALFIAVDAREENAIKQKIVCLVGQRPKGDINPSTPTVIIWVQL